MHRTVATGTLFPPASSSDWHHPWLHAQPAPTYMTKQVIQTALENLPGQEVLIFSSDWGPGSGSRCTGTPMAMSSLSWSRASKPLRSRVLAPRS